MAQAAKSNGTASKKEAPVSDDDNAPGIDDLFRQIETLKKDIKGLTTLVTEVGQAEAQRVLETARNTAVEKTSEVREAGEAQMHQLKATAEGYGRDAGTMLREQPGTVLGFAALVGFLFGWLMNSRN